MVYRDTRISIGMFKLCIHIDRIHKNLYQVRLTNSTKYFICEKWKRTIYDEASRPSLRSRHYWWFRIMMNRKGPTETKWERIGKEGHKRHCPGKIRHYWRLVGWGERWWRWRGGEESMLDRRWWWHRKITRIRKIKKSKSTPVARST